MVSPYGSTYVLRASILLVRTKLSHTSSVGIFGVSFESRHDEDTFCEGESRASSDLPMACPVRY